MDFTNFGQIKKIFGSGMTIDLDDNIFVTMFGGGKIIKVNTKLVVKRCISEIFK